MKLSWRKKRMLEAQRALASKFGGDNEAIAAMLGAIQSRPHRYKSAIKQQRRDPKKRGTRAKGKTYPCVAGPFGA